MADEIEFRTPRKEDILFAGNRENWQMDAILDYRPGNDYVYRQGYRRAGRILTEYVAAGRGEVDFLVFPVCHAYRHFVELSLKRLMLLASELAGRALSPEEIKLQTGSHKLQQLWDAFKTLNQEVENATGISPPPPEQLEGIEAYIAQLHSVDANSMSFRYPLARDGSVHLEGLQRINLGQFSECMEALCNYLDGWDSYFADMIQTGNEMRAEAYSDMHSDEAHNMTSMEISSRSRQSSLHPRSARWSSTAVSGLSSRVPCTEIELHRG